MRGSSRTKRQRNLFEKRAELELAAQKRDEEDATAVVARAEEREAAAAQVHHAYEVQAIRTNRLMKRVVEGVVMYRVSWLNYDSSHNSWEPVLNLMGSEMLIAAFEEKIKTITNPRVSIDQYTQTGRKRKRRKKK